MHLQAKEHLRLPEALTLEPSEEAWPYQHLDFKLLASRARRQNISVVLSHKYSLWCFVTAALGN